MSQRFFDTAFLPASEVLTEQFDLLSTQNSGISAYSNSTTSDASAALAQHHSRQGQATGETQRGIPLHSFTGRENCDDSKCALSSWLRPSLPRLSGLASLAPLSTSLAPVSRLGAATPRLAALTRVARATL